MQKLLTVILLLCSLSCFSQDYYELFQSYNTELLKKQNAKINNVTGFHYSKKGQRKTSSYTAFSAAGLPTTVVDYDAAFDKLKTTKFIYTSFGQPLTITTFQKGKKLFTNEFHYDSTKTLRYFNEYLHSSSSGKKILLWKTIFNYHPNKKTKSITRIDLSGMMQKKQDTAEVSFFDTTGTKTKSYIASLGYKHHFIYEWNQGKSQMKEYDYNGDSLEKTITHKYKDGREIERTESESNKLVVFWKYDKQGRLVQTNAALYFVQDFFYDAQGYLVKETWTATFPELVKENDPKILRFKYEYSFRK